MQTTDDSPEYYRLREQRERELAEKATSEEAKAAHLALAENYRLVAEEADARKQ